MDKLKLNMFVANGVEIFTKQKHLASRAKQNKLVFPFHKISKIAILADSRRL